MDTELFEEVPYRHVVFTVPKLLRALFLRERSLLGALARCGWEAVRRGLAAALGRLDSVPGAVTAQASLGDAANPHPHVHGMFSAGAWLGRAPDAPFVPWPASRDGDRLTQLFRRLVLRMLVRAERLSEATAERLLRWEHSFLAEISAAVPAPGQHTVSQWGRHSNRARGERRKQLNADRHPAAEPSGLPPAEEADPAYVHKRKRFRLAWAQLLRRVWGPGVLACPRCGAAMKVLGAVTKPSAVERILRHLGLFDRPRPPNVPDCPTPPVDAHGQALLAFPPRDPGSCPAPPLHLDEADPRLDDDWPVDPPFDDE